ncbi:MAG TPA: CAP domain-containing protein [Steroidobacteraceae bacterium]|nr:CAP domain-containing protein [Steroidobacteraceae bacterium]
MRQLPGARVQRAAPALLVCALCAFFLFALLAWCSSALGLSVPASVPASAPASAPLALELVQTLRARGCGARAGSSLPLRRPPTLQAAAARWAAGAPLEVAIEAAGYRAERSEALQFRGSAAGLRSVLRQRWCGTLTQPDFRDVGIWGEGQAVWILLAVPFVTPSPADAAAVSQALLERINAARGQVRRCGGRTYPAAPPLQLDARLSRAAERHAHDMLEHDFFAHQGSDGSTPATRVRAAGYRFHLVGENIALGAQSVAQAVQGWLASAEHCANIMDADFRQTGFAFAVNRRGAPRIYWVEDFAAP